MSFVMMLVEENQLDNRDTIQVGILLHTSNEASSGCNLAFGPGLFTSVL